MSKIASLKKKLENRAMSLKSVQKTLGLSDEDMQKALELEMFKLTPSGKSASAISVSFHKFAKYFKVKIIYSDTGWGRDRYFSGYDENGEYFETPRKEYQKMIDDGVIDLSSPYTRFGRINQYYEKFISTI